jgi:hypothetical protein
MKLLSGNKIKSLDSQVNKEPSLVPKPSFLMYLCASRGSGKSTTLLNLLLNKDLLAGRFNQIYYISPTSALDSKIQVLKTTPGIVKVNKPLIKKLKDKGHIKILDSNIEDKEYLTSIPESNFIEEVDISLLKELISEQKKIIQLYDKNIADNILLIYDDCASEKKFWNSQQVQKLIFNSRHFKISMLITSQNYKSLPKSLRLNMSQVVLFSTSNEVEIKAIYDENSSSLGFKEWLKLYREITDKPFNCLVVNYQNKKEYRLQSAFENFILSDNIKDESKKTIQNKVR